MKRKPIYILGILSALTKVLARNDAGNDIRRECGVTPRQWDRFLDDYEKESIPTVNVIELVNGNFHSIRSFFDSPEGNHAAEALFKRLHLEHNDPDRTTGVERPTEEDFRSMLDDGIYTDECGYELILSHSTLV